MIKLFSTEKDYFFDLCAIFLLLGPSCNMSCRHCSQTPIKNTFSLKPNCELSDDVILFIKRWIDARKGLISRIYFWGGEPLLYWNTIKQTILLFESKNIWCQYRIFSNGLLLNDEVADFCNQHNIFFTMSYDAPNPLAVRNKIPSQDNINALLKCKMRSVNSVFNAINHDLVSMFAILEKKFPKTIISAGINDILSDIPKDIYTFKNEQQIEDEIDALANDILAGNDHYGHRFMFFTKYFIQQISFDMNNFIESPFPPCNPGKISLSIKFNGDIVRCHNDNCVISNINCSYNDIYQAHLNEWKKLLPMQCISCPVLPACRMACPIAMLTEDKTEFVHCKNFRHIFNAIIRNGYKLRETGINVYEKLSYTMGIRKINDN